MVETTQQPGGAAHTGALVEPPTDARGRDASSPRRIPRRGWRDVAARVKGQYRDDNITLLGAGIAFFAVLSSVPALAATVAIYGVFSSPEDVARHVEDLAGALPDQARELLTEQLNQVVSTSATGLGVSAVVGIALALWGASAAMKHLIVALSNIYGEHESRGFVSLRSRALLLTIGALLFMGLTVAMLTLGPTVAENLLGDSARTVVSALRWPLIAVLMMIGLAILYRYAPDRPGPRWRWVTWGSAIATAIWLVASALFSLYVSTFGTYDETYGSMAAVVVLMLWLFLSAVCVLLGAEINSELEHQTARDSTTGPDRPLGTRDATMADTIGEPATTA